MASDIKFELSTERLSIRDVFERYGHCLPVIIQVTQGHYSGDIDMDTYSTGHTMRIHSFHKQERVVAKDCHGSHLSIPLDNPITFRVARNMKKVGKEQSLREIIAENSLPVRTELCLPPTGYSLHVGQAIKQIETFGTLHLIDNYDETYLVANSISNESLNTEILFVPIYQKDLMVAIVQGIEGETPTYFNTFRRTLDDLANNLSFKGVKGNPDIAVYSAESVSKSSENTYDFIEPNHFIKYRQTIRERRGSTPQLNFKEVQLKMQKYSESASPGNAANAVGKQQHVAAVDPVRMPQEPVTSHSSTLFSQTSYKAQGPPVSAPLHVSPQMVNGVYVKGYTIRQIIECLESLKLGKYAEAFEDEQINGEILLELDVDILKSDLNMKSIEAIKLLKFARTGHIPR